jgi:hypothetical protein
MTARIPPSPGWGEKDLVCFSAAAAGVLALNLKFLESLMIGVAMTTRQGVDNKIVGALLFGCQPFSAGMKRGRPDDVQLASYKRFKAASLQEKELHITCHQTSKKL